MLDAEIRFEVERARLRCWRHFTADGFAPIWGLSSVPPGAVTITVVVSEADGRTGFLTLAELGAGPRRVLWTEIGTWSADEVAHRTRDHQRRYHSSAVAYSPAPAAC